MLFPVDYNSRDDSGVVCDDEYEDDPGNGEDCCDNDVDHVGDDGENAVSFDKCDNFDVRVDDNALRMIKTLVILWMIAMSVQMSMLMMTLTVSKELRRSSDNKPKRREGFVEEPD